MAKEDIEYPMVALLLLHKKIGDERKWLNELLCNEKDVLKKEIFLLSENAENPDAKYSTRMIFLKLQAYLSNSRLRMLRLNVRRNQNGSGYAPSLTQIVRRIARKGKIMPTVDRCSVSQDDCGD